MNTPLISVILPTFNGARYLADSVGSVLKQSHEKLELIVVIDGSTDCTREILSSIKDARMRVIDRTENRGLPATLNEGLSAARGDFLTWTSDDNFFVPQALSRMLEYLQETNCEIVYAGMNIIDQKGNLLQTQYPGHPALCTVDHNNVGACFLFSRSVYEKTGAYNENMQGVEDYDYWIRARFHFSYAACKEILYNYRLHSSSLTTRCQESIQNLHNMLLDIHYPQRRSKTFLTEKSAAPVEVGERTDFLSSRVAEKLFSEGESGAYAALIVSPSFPADALSGPGIIAFGTPEFMSGNPRFKAASLIVRSDYAEKTGINTSIGIEEAYELIGREGGAVGLVLGYPAAYLPVSGWPQIFDFGRSQSKRYRLRDLGRETLATAWNTEEWKDRLPLLCGICSGKAGRFRFGSSLKAALKSAYTSMRL